MVKLPFPRKVVDSVKASRLLKLTDKSQSPGLKQESQERCMYTGEKEKVQAEAKKIRAQEAGSIEY